MMLYAQLSFVSTINPSHQVKSLIFSSSSSFTSATHIDRSHRKHYVVNRKLNRCRCSSSKGFKAQARVNHHFNQIKPPVVFTFHDESHGSELGPNGKPSKLPILLFLSGLGADPLPRNQIASLQSEYNIVSLGLRPNDKSNWEDLIQYTISKLKILRNKYKNNSNGGITLASESFGTCFAIRLIYETLDQKIFHKHVVINPATGVYQDSFLLFIISILPIITYIDPTERIIYDVIANFIFSNFLIDKNLVSSTLQNSLFDVNRIPYNSLLHRISLLINSNYLDDQILIDSMSAVPTTLVASLCDKLLHSVNEVERLSNLIPNTNYKLLLPYSSHAPLFEKQFDLKYVLNYSSLSSSSNSDDYVIDFENRSKFNELKYQSSANLGKNFYEPWENLINPKYFEVDKVKTALEYSIVDSERPILFIGMHSRCGILDTSLIYLKLNELLQPYNKKLRSLADSIHFKLYKEISGSRWNEFITNLGSVKATPKNLIKLLKNNEAILLFPGGAREVCRRRGEKYSLYWNKQSNFIRLASKYDCIIIPFCTIGADDAVDILIDGQELQKVPFLNESIQQFLTKNQLSNENLMPLTTFPPKLDRFYFKFFDFLDTKDIDHTDKDECDKEFKKLEETIEKGIKDLKNYRENDPLRYFTNRFLHDRGIKLPPLPKFPSPFLEDLFL